MTSHFPTPVPALASLPTGRLDLLVRAALLDDNEARAAWLATGSAAVISARAWPAESRPEVTMFCTSFGSASSRITLAI